MVTEEQVIDVLKTIFDPEIPVNIYELGLIYELRVNSGDVHVKMTLTAPNCPVAESLPRDVENRIKAIAGVRNVEVELVWDPPFTQEMMSDEAKLALGLL